MNSLFSISMDSIMVATLAAFLIITAVLAVLAIRNRLFLKLALRAVPRRRAQSLLIVFGLMLSTAIVTSAFTAGDTFSYSIRSSAAATLSAVDETVTHGVAASRTFRELAPAPEPAYFSPSTTNRLRSALAPTHNADGVLGIIAQPAPLQDLTSRQTKASSFVAGLPPRYPAAFGPLVTTGGSTVTLAQLGAHQVYLNEQAAQALNAHPGDAVRFFVANRPVDLTVRAILRDQGLASGGLVTSNLQAQPEAVLPLARLQAAGHRQGAINEILVSNRGDVLGGAALSTPVVHQLHGTLGSGYTVTPVKNIVTKFAAELEEYIRKGAHTKRPAEPAVH